MSNGVNRSSSSRFTITRPFHKTHDARKEEDIKLELLQNPNTEPVQQDAGFNSKMLSIFLLHFYWLTDWLLLYGVLSRSLQILLSIVIFTSIVNFCWRTGCRTLKMCNPFLHSKYILWHLIQFHCLFLICKHICITYY